MLLPRSSRASRRLSCPRIIHPHESGVSSRRSITSRNRRRRCRAGRRGICCKITGKLGQEYMIATDIRSLQTIRVDHTGALRAPQRLRDATAEYRRGALSKDELDRLRDDTIEDLIRKQEAIGLPVVTDGELRRKNFQDSFNAAVEGFDVADGDRPSGENVDAKPFTRTQSAGQWRWRMSGRLRFVHNVALDEFNFGNRLAHRPVKVTLLSPDRIADRFD